MVKIGMVLTFIEVVGKWRKQFFLLHILCKIADLKRACGRICLLCYTFLGLPLGILVLIFRVCVCVSRCQFWLSSDGKTVSLIDFEGIGQLLQKMGVVGVAG